MSPKVFVSTSSFGTVGREPLERLAAAGCEVELNPHGRKLRTDELPGLLAGVDGLLAGTEPLGREVLAGASSLQAISRCGVGLDNVDLEAARELGISVTNTPDAHVDAVAELVLGGTLDILRRISLSDRRIRAGTWTKPMGSLLRGKTVGILGLGLVGRALVDLLQPFETRILAHDLAPDAAFAAARGVRLCELEALLEASEVLSIHLPFLPSTRGFLDRSRLERLSEGAIVVNAARGGLVDEAALFDLLSSGRLSGAYIDVFEREPYTGPLAELDSVVLTPHIGSYAAEARLAMELEAANNLIRLLDGDGSGSGTRTIGRSEG